MEEENAIKTKQENYITGIIGALIGGVIATIPWVLAYVYGGMMLSILATLIAAGEFYGYKLLKGKMDRHLPMILMVLAIIIVMVVTLVIIPGLLILKEGINVSLSNIQRLYSNESFSTAIIKDFVISVIFTILGASIVTSNIKKQLLKSDDGDNKDIKLDFNNTEEILKIKKQHIELIKPIFIKYDAINQEKAMMKEEVLAEIENPNAKQSFNYLKKLGVVKKYKGKYYYSEENESKQVEPKKLPTWKKVFFIIVILLFIITVTASILDNSKITNKNYEDGNVSFNISSDWNLAQSEHQNEWDFYKYINSVPVLNSENTIEQEDYESYPAGINVFYDNTNMEGIQSIEDIKTNVQSSLESSEDKADFMNMEVSKTIENYDLLKVKMIYNDAPSEVVYYYYIFDGDKIACITAYSFNLKDEEAIEKESNKLVDSFKWVNKE